MSVYGTEIFRKNIVNTQVVDTLVVRQVGGYGGDTEGGRGFLINNRGKAWGEKLQILIHLLVDNNGS